jgi:HK97 gp10 family phage protein
MTVRGILTTKGLEEWLEAIVQAGKDVDASADKALSAGAAVALAGMQERVAVLTGNLQETLAASEPQQDGNFHFVEVGLLRGVDADTARYGNVQEFGSANMPAQPYVRPAIDEGKAAIRKAMRESLKEDGTL